ncbi:hypothetical protein MJH12_12400, partial [bacterium]|nr:hypothetical protein [bacterium]
MGSHNLLKINCFKIKNELIETQIIKKYFRFQPSRPSYKSLKVNVHQKSYVHQLEILETKTQHQCFSPIKKILKKLPKG